MIKNSEQNALIIFARYPSLGKVKTRLASTYGKEFALKFYSKCLTHLFKLLLQNKNDKITQYIFCSEKKELNSMKKFAGDGFIYCFQEGNNLGERLQNAFEKVFNNGASKAVIVGTDVPDTSNEIITQSFELLDSNDIVIGPSFDGGYYLLGMKKFLPDLFSRIDWSTKSVLEKTLVKIKTANLTFAKLEELYDIDEENSLKLWLKKHSEDDNNPIVKFVNERLSN